MATYNMGFHYDEGKRVGYNISVKTLILHRVSSKDKSRIIKELKQGGWKKEDISVVREELTPYY